MNTNTVLQTLFARDISYSISRYTEKNVNTAWCHMWLLTSLFCNSTNYYWVCLPKSNPVLICSIINWRILCFVSSLRCVTVRCASVTLRHSLSKHHCTVVLIHRTGKAMSLNNYLKYIKYVKIISIEHFLLYGECFMPLPLFMFYLKFGSRSEDLVWHTSLWWSLSEQLQSVVE